MKKLITLCSVALASGAALWAAPMTAQLSKSQPISLRDTFPVGSNALCEAQILPPEPGGGLFDRKYSVICRDAAAPIGTLWVVRGAHSADASQRFGGPGSNCATSNEGSIPESLNGALNSARRYTCEVAGGAIRTELLVGEANGRTYAASGLAAYDKALELALASLAEDRVVPGTVDIPLTQTTDALAFARQQAEAIAADQALVEAYRRANSGDFAEAAEFFAASASALTGNSAVEARLNEGLLQSNLGNYSEAARLFGQTRSGTQGDPVLARLQRNYQAIDALNQSRAEQALAILNAPLKNEFGDPEALRNLQIGPFMANRLAAENDSAAGASYALSLTSLERAQLLDGQGDYLRATALRLLGRNDQANNNLVRADATLREVRGGRVVSIIWLRAQVLGELAEVAERTSRSAEAERLHKEGIGLLAVTYPESPAYHSARGQLAGFYARNGRRGDAINLYRSIVKDAQGRPLPSLRSLLAPYFDLLLDDAGSGRADAAAAADIFAASQLLQRPGLAQTQAVLARELSAGDDEAALLFRKTTNISRSIEQLRGVILQMQTSAELSPVAASLLAEREARLEVLRGQQAEILTKLAEYPRYRAVSGQGVELSDLQSILAQDEAYVKLVTLDDESYVLYITNDDATAYQAAATPDELDFMVDGIRESIAIAEDGQILTFPFDIEGARDLYLKLFAPIADRLPAHRHIVFEPDGAMLKLPINLLVTDDESVARYNARLETADGDEYDFTGTAWLGRNSQVTTSVSPAAFRDVRASRPSNGDKAYLGLGQNTPIGDSPVGTARTRSALAGGENCLWSPAIWASPIKADELFSAAQKLGGGTTVLTEDSFTDTGIAKRDDLDQYRILHFATHGLVTAPQPECPPRPALLTSFGEGESDGLLSFAEIFSLRIDADLVILSACDTAGGATVGATREAGVTSGGDFALDGLVRAFVGAGGRTILASHWPVPDDYDATQRLIGGLFVEKGAQTAEALRSSQLGLMDDVETSHPFYWSAFAVVGDGAGSATR
ncbi:MAG: CHAT domain-containing protein [Pseudomonadota bacterium]|nr:CHAT domain-containing protein [Pseudomonadota bacterium]